MCTLMCFLFGLCQAKKHPSGLLAALSGPNHVADTTKAVSFTTILYTTEINFVPLVRNSWLKALAIELHIFQDRMKTQRWFLPTRQGFMWWG
jgi:hypothetical protein